MDIIAVEVVKKADKTVEFCGTSNPFEIARKLNIEVIPCNFNTQLGAYKEIMRNRFIFIKKNLHPAMEIFVMLHEIGHGVLHRQQVSSFNCCKGCESGRFGEDHIEFEANLFATRISLQNKVIKEYIENEYKARHITRVKQFDMNFGVLKSFERARSGYGLFNKIESHNIFRILHSFAHPSDAAFINQQNIP